MKKVLITGGTGLVGSCLSHYLTQKGYQVAHLSRTARQTKIKTYLWDYKQAKIDSGAIEFADVVIHLAGENISTHRWTKKQRQLIIDSRVETTNLLRSAIEQARNKPDLFISASAIGYYGTFNSERIFTEKDEAGSDFLAKVVKQWEQAVDRIETTGTSVVKLRTGVVMDFNKGAFQEMIKPIKMGLASALGSGKQYVPWISNSDLARMYEFVIEKSEEGSLTGKVYNAVAPQYITNKQMTYEMAMFFKKPMFVPAIPAFILKILFGEMAAILLYGSRINSDKIIQEGFNFESQTLKLWLENIC